MAASFTLPPPRPLSLLCFSNTDTVLSVRSELGDSPLEVMLQNLTGYVTKDEDYPAAPGGFWDIWKCTCYIDQSPIKFVAVKALQAYTANQLVGLTLQRSSDDTKAALIPYKLGGVYDRHNWQDLASLLLEIPLPSSLPGGVVAYLRAEPRPLYLPGSTVADSDTESISPMDDE
ncbi:hypothetical protein F4604DRAFT_1951599 [Suillus subluteus]|nr:hypothetical protein F4604DRAFT_1951599 [Suillus subluteus]